MTHHIPITLLLSLPLDSDLFTPTLLLSLDFYLQLQQTIRLFGCTTSVDLMLITTL